MKNKASSSSNDPLKDETKLKEISRRIANKVLKAYHKKKTKMTRMQFCCMVLEEGFGLRDWGVAGHQRRTISKARMEELGKMDKLIMKKPPTAADVHLPCTQTVYQELSMELLVSAKQPTRKVSIETELDARVLKQEGIFHIPNCVPPSTVVEILEYLAKLEEEDKKLKLKGRNKKLHFTLLRPPTGNGQGGGYATLTAPPQCLNDIQNELQQALHNKLGVKSGSKTLFLKYGVGGVNWAHQDQSKCPYQALLLLSRPGVDFREGQLYVADPGLPNNKTFVDFQCSGDLVIFAANNTDPTATPFYHGMTKVLPGQNKDDKDSHRLAIGLLQT